MVTVTGPVIEIEGLHKTPPPPPPPPRDAPPPPPPATVKTLADDTVQLCAVKVPDEVNTVHFVCGELTNRS
jgi:hypothetical protein